ncbi:LPS export ABC transporter permease LptF [Donghicola eburneus]|uniref:LPS export ABC transporter permease LptF n=1 Tax=Donghicola eburneus TaxID=393278 RepID=UPI0008F3A1F3|nr:LPS export ABC transporter permease LptF [Donghicola eburneus]SFQ23120.1 lipopolysaccharide export system permease protein [Donghicola eburneus]
MGRTDRYMLSQLMVLFGFFALVLVSIYWINRAVVLFDTLIGDGQSVAVFLEFSMLSLPAVIGLVLPLASFAAAVQMTNRLSSESELVVMQATGFSPWRLARPVAIFGIAVAILGGVLTNGLIPASSEQLKLREKEISQNMTAKLLKDGVFLHPTRGVTFYIRGIAENGTLEDMFLSDNRDSEARVTYTAKEAYLTRSDGRPRMVMVDGMSQSLDRETGRLSVTYFEDFVYDVSGFLTSEDGIDPNRDFMSTWDLLTKTSEMAALAGDTEGEILETAHKRINDPLLCLVTALLGFSALLAGGFSRFGSGAYILLSIFLIIVLMIIQSAVKDPARTNAALWWLTYLPSVAGFGMIGVLLSYAAGYFRRTPKGEVSA